MAKIDIKQDVTNRIIEQLETGVAPWRKGWANGANAALPVRATGQAYRGINVILLGMQALAKGYKNPVWMTFKQAQKEGGCVRKGEKACRVVYSELMKKEDKETGETKTFFFERYYSVFNVEQIEGLPADRYAIAEAPKVNEDSRDAELDQFIAATGAEINTGGNRAFYMPSTDQITMPEFAQFKGATPYYTTLAHELVHWTGATHRLDRELTMERKGYAFEELVAELGACFTLAAKERSIEIDNSAAYINSWLRALKGDKKFIFDAASKAAKASEYLDELATGEIKYQAA